MRRPPVWLIAATVGSFGLITISMAQAPESPRPAPRHADGHVNLGAPVGEPGVWDGPTGGSVIVEDLTLTNRTTRKLPSNLALDEVPFQPWAKELFEERHADLRRNDPHHFCKPSGGPRMFHTPYGFEFLDLVDQEQILILGIGGAHTWRIVHMDGRSHPSGGDLDATWQGHSVGRWEGDTLVIDTVGFNEKFWISRLGFPHTEQLHLIERFSRPDFHSLRYEVTIDDPGAYTEPWTGGWFIPWLEDGEMFEYICQENNLDADVLQRLDAAAQ